MQALLWSASPHIFASNFGVAAVIAKVDMKGVDNLGGDFLNPPAHSRTAIPPAFKKKLEDLLNHPDVVAAFQTVNRI
jgi:hypothetical protein